MHSMWPALCMRFPTCFKHPHIVLKPEVLRYIKDCNDMCTRGTEARYINVLHSGLECSH
eukprot:m.21149 g.21149  ORF g.21149 m.21149 type:complete len:59 (+) comp12315_c0_seq2:186-362(+)